MSPPAFTAANLRTHRDQLIELNLEYVGWVFREVDQLFGVQIEHLLGMPLSDYVASSIDKVCDQSPPSGIFYLISVDGELAGMGGFRGLTSGQAEIKRIYVRPKFRGMKLGYQAVNRLLSDARSFGYQRVCLDTGPFQAPAHRIYEQNGFVDCPPYEGVEVPTEFHARWRFMERAL